MLELVDNDDDSALNEEQRSEFAIYDKISNDVALQLKEDASVANFFRQEKKKSERGSLFRTSTRSTLEDAASNSLQGLFEVPTKIDVPTSRTPYKNHAVIVTRFMPGS